MEISKVKITKYYANDQSKDKKPYVDRNGNAYKRVAIQTDQHGANWLSKNAYRPDDPSLAWEVGDVVEISVEQNGQWWNFSVPSRTDRLEMRIAALESGLAALRSEVEWQKTGDKPKLGTFDAIPSMELPDTGDDLPF